MSEIGREFIDDLTGLYNRRFLNRSAVESINEADQRKTLLSIALIDLDHFKNVNDIYGHSRGDSVLKEFAVFLKDLLRKDDTVYRYGGDEFVCILPNTDYEQARRISLRFIEQCRRMEFVKIRLTMSIGIASFPSDGEDWLAVFNTADHQLYSAKRHGRDRIGTFKKEEKKLIIPTVEIIGRDEEIERVKKLINPVFTGSSGAVCISGEVGVGKTRLVHEIVSASDYQEYGFLISNLSATTKSIPYYPFRDIIRSVIETEGRGSITEIPGAYQIELIKIIPELSDELTETDKGIFMIDKFRLFDGVRRFLSIQASKSPLFICLDNIQWADNGSLELFHYLVRVLRESPVFFFFVYRIEEAKDSTFQNVMQLMAREGLYEKIELEPLEPAAVARMLAFMIDDSPSPELNDYINRETGGNPFFIEELMKSLEQNDAFTRDKDRVLFDESKKVVIPYSVKGVVDRKLGMISSEASNLLEYAAVIGREFNFTFLRDTTRMNEGHLFDLMDEIIHMRLLKESRGERYYFSEDVIREVIYNRINKAKLRRYHRSVGKMLLSINKDNTEEIVEELSHHFYLCGDRKRAIKFSMIAADRAKNAYANRDAIEFYTRTLECLSESEIEKKGIKGIECLKKRAAVLDLVGENEKAIEDLTEAISKAKVLCEKKLEADCLIALCRVYFGISHYDDTIEMAEKALDIYRGLNDKNGEAEGLNCMGIANWYLGEFDDALKLYQSSLEIVKSTGNQKFVAMILGNSSIIFWNLGEYSKALTYYLRALDITKKLGDSETEGRALNNIGLIYSTLDDNAKALECYEQSLKISKEIGNRQLEASILNNIGIVNVRSGEYARAIKHYMDSLHISLETGTRKVEAMTRNNIGILYCNLGDYSSALEYCKNSLKISGEISDRQTETESFIGAGDIYLEQEHLPEAEEYYNKAYSTAQMIKSKSLLVEVLICLTRLYLEKNELDKVGEQMERISSLVDEIDSKKIKAEISCLSGRFLAKRKKWDKAKNTFKESVTIFKELENHFSLAQVYYYQGLMLRESGAKIEAEKHFIKAQKIFRKLDAKGWIKKTGECLKKPE